MMRGLKKRDYETELERLQVTLNDLTHWLRHTRRRVLVIFEGRDAAGKGGTISAIAGRLNPRQVHIVALPSPSEQERGQWSFQRYVPHLPAQGELVLFDRSWYNRAGVERVMGFCADAEYRRFLVQAPVFERLLVNDGIVLLKYWLTVDQAQQKNGLPSERPIRSNAGKCRRSISKRGLGTSNTVGRAMRCSGRPTRARRRGSS